MQHSKLYVHPLCFYVFISSASTQMSVVKPWEPYIALGTEDREFPRAPPTSVRSANYSSIRKSFLVFWPSRDIARQPCHPPTPTPLTGVTDLTGLVTTVDSLGDGKSHNFNLLKLRTANSLAVSLAGWLSSRPLPGKPQRVHWELSNVRHQETCS